MENNWLRRRVLEKKNPGRQQPCWGSLFCTNLTQPTGNLDRSTGAEIIRLLKESNRSQKQTLLLITHDERIALQADRMLCIEDGKITRDERIRVLGGGAV